MQQAEKVGNKQGDNKKIGEDNLAEENVKNEADDSNLTDNIRTKPSEGTHRDIGNNDNNSDIPIRGYNSRISIQDSAAGNISLKPNIGTSNDTNATPTPNNTRRPAGSGIGTIIKNFSERRLRARNNINPTLATQSQRQQLAEDVRNDECGMQKMKSDTSIGNNRGGKFKLKLKERFSQLSTAVLAPKAAIDKMIDPDDGEENLGFYRHVVVLQEDGIDP